MIIFANFKKVTPVTNDQLKLGEMGVQFLTDEDGRCWYDIIKELKAEHDGEYVVVVGDDYRVKGWSQVADSLFPVDASIVVAKKIPLGMMNNNGYWKFDAPNRVFIPDNSFNISAMQSRKDNELYMATTEIEALKDAVEDGSATKEELERLAALKTYRLALVRLDVTSEEGVEFPPKP